MRSATTVNMRRSENQSPRRLAIVSAAAIVASLAGACGSAGTPRIELGNMRADLGSVTNGQKKEVTTAVFNTGTAPLQIDGVSTSCGCTTAAVVPTIIPAGKAGTLHVTFDSGAHGPEFAGTVERQVFIDSNDPDQREVIFTLKANVTIP